jgi:hypothetical protein
MSKKLLLENVEVMPDPATWLEYGPGEVLTEASKDKKDDKKKPSKKDMPKVGKKVPDRLKVEEKEAKPKKEEKVEEKEVEEVKEEKPAEDNKKDEAKKDEPKEDKKNEKPAKKASPKEPLEDVDVQGYGQKPPKDEDFPRADEREGIPKAGKTLGELAVETRNKLVEVKELEDRRKAARRKIDEEFSKDVADKRSELQRMGNRAFRLIRESDAQFKETGLAVRWYDNVIIFMKEKESLTEKGMLSLSEELELVKSILEKEYPKIFKKIEEAVALAAESTEAIETVVNAKFYVQTPDIKKEATVPELAKKAGDWIKETVSKFTKMLSKWYSLNNDIYSNIDKIQTILDKVGA